MPHEIPSPCGPVHCAAPPPIMHMRPRIRRGFPPGALSAVGCRRRGRGRGLRVAVGAGALAAAAAAGAAACLRVGDGGRLCDFLGCRGAAVVPCAGPSAVCFFKCVARALGLGLGSEGPEG
jgi:hypothetical protein